MMRHTPFTRAPLLTAAAAAQALCAALLLVDIRTDLPELAGDPTHGLLDYAVLAMLLLGSGLIANELRILLAQNRHMKSRLRLASGAFHALLEDTFRSWALTPAETTVALLTIKGFSIAEIAGFREAQEGTVRAQCASIYRKAGVSGRTQLLSHFIDDLMAGFESGPAERSAPDLEPALPVDSGT
jgi:DNA-binding CsgD family transcriptional regulator